MHKIPSAFICVLFIASLLTFSGCVNREEVGDLQNVQKTVPLGDAKSVDAIIAMGIGKLSISGGSSNLMDGEFIYNVPSWKPEISYSVASGVGNLTVRQPSNQSVPEGSTRYEWNLRLNQNVPMNLWVSGGTGDTRLQLGGMSLTGLNIDSGTGNLVVDLSGDWKKSLNVNIKSGIGKLDITLPRDVGALVEVSNAIGTIQYDSGLMQNGNTYFNSAYGKANVTLSIQTETGLGTTNIRLA
ncbi:MAG TPA: toast rack family protein [Methanotrichaceae archaeon]|nr:toast rack family protein [Methanotrichaceae archaeon]